MQVFLSALIERFYSTDKIVLDPLLCYLVAMHSVIPPGPYNAAQSPLSDEVNCGCTTAGCCG